MEIKLLVNSKWVTATVDEQEMKDAMGEKKEKRTGYEKSSPDYYYQSPDGYVRMGRVTNDSSSIQSAENGYNAGNHYSSKEVATQNARADALMRKLRRFAAEHGGCVAPKNAGWEIDCDRRNHSLNAHYYGQVSSNGIILFSTKEDAVKAIEVFRDDLLWYFTEYDPMPEGWWDS